MSMITFKVDSDFMITCVDRNIYVHVSWLAVEPTGCNWTFYTFEKRDVPSRTLIRANINHVAMHTFLMDQEMFLHYRSEINEIMNVPCHRIYF